MIAFVCMLASWLLPSTMWASVQVNGIYYDLNTSAKTAAVASNPDYYSGAINIPASFVYNGNTYNVTSIGSTAFLDCSRMTEVIMPSSVTSIAASAFERCSGLTFLHIGKGVTTINYEAFKNCSNLSSLILPASVKTIGNETFSGCTSLAEIIVERTTAPTISSSTFNGVDKSSCTVFVPEGYRSSYANASNWKTFSNIVERTVLATGKCGNDLTYTIYSDMTMVVSGTGAMTDYVYNTHINNDYYQSVKKLIIEDGVSRIGNSAFGGCKSLTLVSIPNSVKSIGRNAFYDCICLNSLTIPISITFIDEDAFQSCLGLTSIHIFDLSAWCNIRFAYKYGHWPNCSNPLFYAKHLYLNGEELKDLLIPDDVLSIGDLSFVGCEGLTSVTIPSSVTSIGHYAFEDCANLASVSFSNNINFIGGGAFRRTAWEYNLPNGLIYVGKVAYKYNGDISEDSEIIIENGVVSISDFCFSEIENLNSVVIPYGVKFIGAAAFGFTDITSITIPSTVDSIGGEAFYGCNLETIIAKSKNPARVGYYVGAPLFSKDISPTLYVPIGSKQLYKGANEWNRIHDIIEMEMDTEIAALDNAIYVDQVDGLVGGTMDIPVKMKSDFAVRGFQFTMELPEGATINSWQVNPDRLPSGISANEVMPMERIEGNRIDATCVLNDGNKTFTGYDGVIATVNVTFGSDMEAGTYPIYLTEASISDASSTNQKVLSDIKATLVLDDYVAGDTNGDGKVLIGDVIAILNYIVGDRPENFNVKAADVNGDGLIVIGDVIAVLNIIVGL